MQETLEQRMARLSGVKQPETLEERMARLAAAQSQPAARPPLWDRVKDVGRAIADDPLGAAKNIGKGLVQNATDLVALTGTTRGDYQPMMRVIADEIAHGDGAGKRLAARAVGAASLGVPALRVGGVATTMLANTAANAGLGAAQTPDDPMLGATLGAVVPHVMGATSRLARTATSKLSRAVRPLETLSLDGATNDVLRGVESSQRNVIPKRRPSTGVKIQPEKIDAFAEVGNEPAVDFLLRLRSQRADEGLNAATVRPQTPRAPVDVLAYPEGYQASLDAPQAEVRAVPGAEKLFVDQEVKASRVQDERIATAEQRDAEARMTKEVRALDGEAERAATQAEKDAVKATKQAEKEQQRAANALAQEQAKAARDAEKAAATAERAAQAAAKAAKLQADAAALEAAKAVGKDAVKEVRAQQAAEKAAQRAADAQAKADFAVQAALDAQAKRQMADEAAARTTPSVKEKTVRLYRVEPKDLGDKGEWLKGALPPADYEKFVSERGRLFSDNLSSLENYGHGSPDKVTYYVDVPESVAKRAGRKHHADDFTEYLLDPESVASKRPLGEAHPPATALPAETASGMLNVANAQYNRTQRGKMAAQAALARRKPLSVASVTPEQVGGAPMASGAPISPVDAPTSPLAAPLTPSNAPAIPEVPPVVIGAADAPPVSPDTGAPITSPWKASEEPYMNWRTLGEGSDDPFTRTIAARVRGELETPAMAEKLRQLRGSASFDAQLAAADDTYFIQKLNLDRKLTDPMKLAKLTGAQKQRMVQVGLENVAMSKAISEEILTGNLSPDDIALAHAKLDMLDQGASEIWQMAAREGSQHGRDLGIGRMVAGMSTDPSVWLVRAQRALGDKPMSADVVSEIMRLAKEAAEACGGG